MDKWEPWMKTKFSDYPVGREFECSSAVKEVLNEAILEIYSLEKELRDLTEKYWACCHALERKISAKQVREESK